MLIIDAIVRGMAAGLSLMIALVVLSGNTNGFRRLAPLALCLTLSAYLISHSGWAEQIPHKTMIALLFITGFLPAAMVWAILTFFLDCCNRLWIWPMLCLPTVPLCLLAYFDPSFRTLQLSVLMGIYLALLGVALATWRQDLVQKRRQFRIVLMFAIALVSVVFVGMEFVWTQEHHLWIYPVQGITVALLVAVFGMWVLTTDTIILAPEPIAQPPAPQPSDQDWIATKLSKAMTDGLWQREGLTITALADHLGVPEYRLRETINQRLGYRNFPAFINGYRIEAAKTILADSEQTGRSILEIAYDVGFASLGPFNRAFRDGTGQSPRDFRRDALENHSPIVEKTRQIVN